MDNWDRKRYEQEKRSFIERRIHQAPLWSQFTLIFGVSWGAAWFCSWFLWRFFADSHLWASSLPIRYAIAFLFSYGCFFLAVRVWIDHVKRDPQHQNGLGDLGNLGNFGGGGDAEGCFIVLAMLAVGFVVGGLFFAAGGAPMLLEAAFEAAFAGVIVRRLSGDFVLGGWKMRLLKNTWKQALICILVLVAVAAWLQRHAPQTSTFSEVIRTMTHGKK